MASSSSSPLLPMHNNNNRPPRPPPLRSNNNNSSATTQRQPPVTITIRFSVAMADLVLSISNPHSTTVAALKRLIRSRRPEDTSRRRLKLIYGGKVLADQGVIGEIVGLPRFMSSLPPPLPQPPPPPPRRSIAEVDDDDDDFKELRLNAVTAKRSRLTNKGKGKAGGVTTAVDGGGDDDDEDFGEPAEELPPTRNVYIHCSVGEELDDADLAEEAISESQAAHQPSTLPVPQGFDRLLAAGFTEADVAALRSQFHGSLVNTASNSASIGPGIEGPIPDRSNAVSLNLLDEESRRRALALEERWIDESANNDAGVGGDAGGGGIFGGGGGGGAGTTGAGGAIPSTTGLGGYEDFLIGLLWGFFWPVCVVWIFREEVMSQRKYVAVAVGVIANLFFGVLRVSA